VPSLAEELVIAPGQQGTATIVLDQQIDIDERRDPADEEEDVPRKAVVRVAERGFHRRDERA
jgi:hypothetical protein